MGPDGCGPWDVELPTQSPSPEGQGLAQRVEAKAREESESEDSEEESIPKAGAIPSAGELGR